MEIFFYLPKKYSPSEDWLQAWQEHRPLPLKDSGKAATAHAWIYQTWRLLTEAGINTSLVTELPTTGIVIALSGTLNSCFQPHPTSSDFFLIDIVADALPHPGAAIHLVQNQAHARRLPNSFFMPHWPQPALRPREKNRGTNFEKIAFFGDPHNLAPELLAPSWQERLKKDLSLELKLKKPDQWHDYSDVDAVIAVRDFSRRGQLHKPATKLYNAWLASVPFIGGNDSAYHSDGKSGIDYLLAHSPDQILQHLRRLKEDIGFRNFLIQNGNESGKKFNQVATLERWKNMIQKTLPLLSQEWKKKSSFHRHCYLFAQRFFCFIDRKLR